jgi:hypothetical protein
MIAAQSNTWLKNPIQWRELNIIKGKMEFSKPAVGGCVRFRGIHTTAICISLLPHFRNIIFGIAS